MTHYQPIGSYGIIGDLHTVALVGMDGASDLDRKLESVPVQGLAQ